MDQKPMTNKQVFILILGITAFVVPLILYLSHLFPDKPTKIDDEGVEVISIKAEDLIDNFYNNEVKSKAEYIPQWLEVDGKISNIDGNNKKAKLRFYNDSLFDFLSVTCFIDDQDSLEKVLDLNTGDRVTVTGKLVRKLLGDLELRQCKIK